MKKEAGQSLMEIVFILGVTVLLLTGVVVSAIFSLKVARYSKMKAKAARLARQILEGEKSAKQESSFWTTLEVGCHGPLGPLEESFYYKICYSDLATSDGRSKVKIRVVVWWDSLAEPETKNKVAVETVLSNWEQ